MNNQFTVLATAYAVNPYKGSEDGMGWNFALQIARHNKLILITRQNNRASIEKYMGDHSNPFYENIHILYFDLPYWMRFWKKGGRGALLYFWMWQRAVPSFVKRLKVKFDVCHNLNFHNDWTPSYLWKLQKPFVWGPIGHHPSIPIQYLRKFGWKSVLRDRLTWLIKNIMWKLPGPLKQTVSHASHIISMNSEVGQHLRLNDRPNSIIPSVASEPVPVHGLVARLTFRVMSVGRLVELKGFDLTIRSFAKFVQTLKLPQREACELLIVGNGPLKQRLMELVKSIGIESNVRFIDWMDRSDLMELYRQSSVFLFPSHEGAGMVVAEALSMGLPVVCLDNSGPGEFIDSSCGLAIRQQEYNETVSDLAIAIGKLYNEPGYRFKLSKGAVSRFQTHFDWRVRGEQLNKIYQSIVA